ncbi:MAG: hypothetical protein QM758_03550 [Armatimonas sp.]
MTIQTFLKVLGGLILVGGIGLILANQWHYQNLGGIEVRRHGLSGSIQLKENGEWTTPAIADTRAPAVPAAILKTAKVDPPSGSWGTDQLMAFTAVTQEPIKGRIAVHILIRDTQNRVVMRGDKSLRLTVDWPGKSRVPVVLDTTVDRPTFPHTIVVSLENIDQQGT